mmetsp:Transcript_14278/g.45751  ORF Transcript_14278/g.45751 Transcript_14278/m.45751 type:complete len:347 (-) Transcript_14278:438-1478(-)
MMQTGAPSQSLVRLSWWGRAAGITSPPRSSPSSSPSYWRRRLACSAMADEAAERRPAGAAERTASTSATPFSRQWSIWVRPRKISPRIASPASSAASSRAGPRTRRTACGRCWELIRPTPSRRHSRASPRSRQRSRRAELRRTASAWSMSSIGRQGARALLSPILPIRGTATPAACARTGRLPRARACSSPTSGRTTRRAWRSSRWRTCSRCASTRLRPSSRLLIPSEPARSTPFRRPSSFSPRRSESCERWAQRCASRARRRMGRSTCGAAWQLWTARCRPTSSRWAAPRRRRCPAQACWRWRCATRPRAHRCCSGCARQTLCSAAPTSRSFRPSRPRRRSSSPR